MALNPQAVTQLAQFGTQQKQPAPPTSPQQGPFARTGVQAATPGAPQKQPAPPTSPQQGPFARTGVQAATPGAPQGQVVSTSNPNPSDYKQRSPEELRAREAWIARNPDQVVREAGMPDNYNSQQGEHPSFFERGGGTAPQQQVRGNFIDKAGKWFEENVTSPVVEGVKEVGRAIDRPHVEIGKAIGKAATDARKAVTDATGLTTPDVPDEAKVKLDPAKVGAMAQYGTMVQDAARQFSPGDYGPTAFRPREFTPQITQPKGQPGPLKTERIEAPSTAINRRNEGEFAENLSRQVPQPGQSAVPREGSIAAPNLGMVGQIQPEFTKSTGAPTLDQQKLSLGVKDLNQDALNLSREEGRGLPQRYTESTQQFPNQTNEGGRGLGPRQAESTQPLPEMQRENGANLNLGKVSGIQPDIQQFSGAISKELEGAQGPLNLQQGFDPRMREAAVSLATSGIQQQKQDALTRLKEEQMASGNYGSSVGQKQMTDLAKQYDDQVSQATQNIDIQNMTASREDRYRNLTAEQQRAAQVQSLAGTGYNIGMGSGEFSRGNVQMDNAAAQIQADYARQGRQIDNATAMKLAQYGQQGRQIDFENQGREAGFGREGALIDQATEERRFDAARDAGRYDQDTAERNARFEAEGRATDRSSTMAEKGFSRDTEVMNNQIAAQKAEFEARGIDSNNAQKMTLAQFGQGQIQMNNQIEALRADFAQRGIQLDNDTLMRMAQDQKQSRATDTERDRYGQETEFNQKLQLAGFGQGARDIDYRRDLGEQMTGFEQDMSAGQFNRQGDGLESDDAWRRHQEQTRQGQYSDQITNAAGLFNIGQGDKARQDQYNAYQDSLRNLAGFGQNPLDPQSVIDSEAYNKSESDRQQRVADTIGTVIKVGGMLINAKTGQPVTSELGPDTVAEEQPGSYRGPRVARR